MASDLTNDHAPGSLRVAQGQGQQFSNSCICVFLCLCNCVFYVFVCFCACEFMYLLVAEGSVCITLGVGIAYILKASDVAGLVFLAKKIGGKFGLKMA